MEFLSAEWRLRRAGVEIWMPTDGFAEKSRLKLLDMWHPPQRKHFPFLFFRIFLFFPSPSLYPITISYHAADILLVSIPRTKAIRKSSFLIHSRVDFCASRKGVEASIFLSFQLLTLRLLPYLAAIIKISFTRFFYCKEMILNLLFREHPEGEVASSNLNIKENWGGNWK